MKRAVSCRQVGRVRRGRSRRRISLRVLDRGSATVEVAVLFPAFLVLLFAGVQGAEWYHARSVCLAAADAGVQAARSAGVGPAEGKAAAVAFLARVGGGSVSDVTVSTAGSTTTVVRVRVTGTAPRVLPIPGLAMRITQSAEAPREVFTTDGAS